MNALVAYYRVSTDKQGRSGLGLEAQEASVTRYAAATGGELIARFTEVESGRRNDRPQLAAAMRAAKKAGAVLVIATLDRLGRDVHFVTGLMKARVAFRCADMPEADTAMLQMRAVMAEWEARKISERTRAALAAKKAQGAKLGNPRQDELNARRAAERAAFRNKIAPTVRELRARGLTVDQVRDELNRRGIPSMLGKRWHRPTVYDLVKRIEQQEGAAA